MRLKSLIEGLNKPNDSNLSRPLLESVIAPEVSAALKQWIGSTDVPGVLIGGLALSFYVKPRYTIDVDVLYLSDDEIPDQIRGFKRTCTHGFQHNQTHVEVEVLSPKFLKISPELAHKVVETAVVSNGMKIANKGGLVAMKLHRGNLQDQADIVALLQTGNVDMEPFIPLLDEKQKDLLQKLYSEVENDQ